MQASTSPTSRGIWADLPSSGVCSEGHLSNLQAPHYIIIIIYVPDCHRRLEESMSKNSLEIFCGGRSIIDIFDECEDIRPNDKSVGAI
ncbi:hypothetical protein PM082_015475 [Marasmius tenuissimus]|nr:hypothetical protein PM082_015475 [Marasmius tenuissimus]